MGQEQDIFPRLPAPLLAWYDTHARVLPWRGNPAPYRVWISEIMLQQTRVEAVKPYFERFLAELPDLEALAAAPEDVLLKLWEGLGYYNRVRNLRKAAKAILERYGGVFPSSCEELMSLPGIGEYTAGAIASISFGLPCPAVDGNVLRVIARVTENRGDVMKDKVRGEIASRLKAVYPAGRCGGRRCPGRTWISRPCCRRRGRSPSKSRRCPGTSSCGCARPLYKILVREPGRGENPARGFRRPGGRLTIFGLSIGAGGRWAPWPGGACRAEMTPEKTGEGRKSMTTEYLLNREVGHILAALTPQNALIMETVLQTGLRISDVLELRTEQLRPSMWVREKKTGKMHRCGLPKDLLVAILVQAGEVWAFPGTKPGTHKTRQAVWKDVKRAARAFRLPQNIGTHSFRKVYAVRLREKYGSIAKVQRALAHSSLAVTAVYAMADALLSDSQQRRERQRAQRRTVET